MKIDVQSIIIEPTELQKFIMDVYDWQSQYHFMYANGDSATAVFNEKSMAEFQPSRTVSEMMKIWQDGIENKILAIENGLKYDHAPYRRSTRCPKASYIYNKQEYFVKEDRYKYEDFDTLTKEDRKYWEKNLTLWKSRRGRLVFQEITNRISQTVSLT